jgi:hypothetical protein
MNAEEVARFLGCSSKTVRRHLEKGTITASRKASGELKISEDQVEKLRLVLELEGTSRQVQPTASIGRQQQPDMSRQVETDIDTLTARIVQLEHQPEISVLTRELGKLQAKVDVQDARISELERRITELEARDRLSVPVPATSDIPPKAKPQKQPSDASSPVPSDLLPGTLLATDFAKQVGIKYTVLEGAIRHGMALGRGKGKDYLDITERYGRKYFDPEQQEKAIELLRKHGKLDTN